MMLGRYERRRDRDVYTTRLQKRRETRHWKREAGDMFRDATQDIRDALRDPAMREKVAQVRAEMDLEDARASAIQAIDGLCEQFRTQGPWKLLAARQECYEALGRVVALTKY